MKHRAEAARRIVRVRAQMARLAEWRRIASEQSLAAVETARVDLDGFVAESAPTGPLAQAAFLQTRRLSQREQDAAAERDRHVAAQQDAQRRLKTAETLADDLTRGVRDKSERRELERLIDSLANPAPSASLR